MHTLDPPLTEQHQKLDPNKSRHVWGRDHEYGQSNTSMHVSSCYLKIVKSQIDFAINCFTPRVWVHCNFMLHLSISIFVHVLEYVYCRSCANEAWETQIMSKSALLL